jgi:WD40 repeat protein
MNRLICSELLTGLSLCAALFLMTACASNATASSRPSTAIVLTDTTAGRAIVVNRATLATVAIVAPRPGVALGSPMLAAVAPTGSTAVIGNFEGGLGIIECDAPATTVMDLDGALTGVAFSPDGRWVAVNGATDLTLRILDRRNFTSLADQRNHEWTSIKIPFGNAADPPKHSHMTHGIASTHPIWLSDSSAVLTEDNIHEEIVLIATDGKILARRAMKSGTHSFLHTRTGEVLAICEGTVDGTVPPRIEVLTLPSLAFVREMIVPLDAGEAAKLHHADLSPDGETLVVANMGPMHGDGAGHTVTAFHWRTGELLWSAAAVTYAGHVRFLDDRRVAVIGHSTGDIAVMSATTGATLARWSVPQCQQFGHAFELEADGSLLVVDATSGRLVRLKEGQVVATSASYGSGVSEASLAE